jgi:ribosomal protein S18 acetylase RimI-like enzyme
VSVTRPRLRLLQATDFTPEGTEELYRLFNDSILQGGTIGFLRPMTRRKAQEYFESLKRGIHKGETIAVVSGSKPFTGFGLIRRDDGELFRHCWEMGRVMVRPTMQRHGLGAAIVQRLVAEAKRRKIEVLWLDVRITNVPAIELFQKIGFRTWGIFPNRIKAGRDYTDVLYMACDLRTTYHPLRDLP